jgi:hypothetical protein
VFAFADEMIVRIKMTENIKNVVRINSPFLLAKVRQESSEIVLIEESELFSKFLIDERLFSEFSRCKSGMFFKGGIES